MNYLIVKKYVDFLFEELHLTNEVLGVLLYGSYVLNEEDEFSDLDILIIVEENNKNICGRGNIIKDSIPIEYFIKTEKDIYKELDLYFCYYNYLYELIKAYCDYEKVPIRKYKFYKTYTNDDYRIKNMQLEIKDEYVKSESIYLISNLPNEYRIYRNKDFYYD